MHLLDLWESLATKQPTWVLKPVLVSNGEHDAELLGVEERGDAVRLVTNLARDELTCDKATEYLQGEGFRVIPEAITPELLEKINTYIAAGQSLTLANVADLWDALTDPPA